MFKHILVPSDLTERNRKAMDIAVKMALVNGAVITLLHVVETMEEADSDDFKKFYKQLGTRANKVIDKLIAQYGPKSVSIEKQILYGKRVFEIINFAAEHEVDLIIMTLAQTRSRERRRRLGYDQFQGRSPFPLPGYASKVSCVKRRIMHLDMDAFYAAVEQSDNPQLLGKPVIVGGAMRGVVCAASYEARRFGVHSAMPVFQAIKLCPEGIFLPVRMDRYKEVSCMVMEILKGISPLVEQVSIDEAFADITGTERLHGPPQTLALRVKEAVREGTALTCSIGIAPNKFLAKIASDFKKPDGLTIIAEEQVREFLQKLPVGKIPGVEKRPGKS